MRGKVTRVVALALALLGALAVAIAAFMLMTGGDDTAPVLVVAPEATPSPGPTPTDIRVQISGAVASPGVYSMSEGDRVMDVLAAAGGARPGADLSALNLARRVEDEAHYHVPPVGSTAAPGIQPFSRGTVPQAGSDSYPLVDLNSASARELESLPGIGPVMAERIVAHREANGPFASVDDIEGVPGIGPKTLESIRSLATASGSP